ncbi:MAG: hypothetical protein ABIN44_08265 [Burkholderiaceae bacterium]
MANERRSQYRGCSITTRWAESELPEHALPKQFTASFSVDSPQTHDSAWQQFPEESFGTAVRAADNALEIARDLIDRRLTDKHFSGRGRSG